jgi:N,N'-diacetyllegionaminate synthase
MLKLGKKQIGDGYPVYIVFEIGATHHGIESAKQLVQFAAGAGADAVKFQILDPERLVPDKTQMFSYDILLDKATGATREVSEPLFDILMRRFLPLEQWRELKAFCDDLGIQFFSTATFLDEVDFLSELNCETIKICSGDVNHYPLIRHCARTGMIVQLDTGNATIGEVERAVDEIREAGNDRIIIHNCPSGYPARLESIHLNMIPTLKQMFSVPVAFSDHTPGWDMDIAAIALGANMLEKTITLDRTIPGVEHMFSLEPEDMKAFVTSIRDVEASLGKKRRIMTPDERLKGLAVRRSMVTRQDVRAGDIISGQTVDFVRPGFGLEPGLFDRINGKKFLKSLQKGHVIDWEDFG